MDAAYLEDAILKNYSPATIKFRRGFLRRFHRFLGEGPLTLENCLAYLSSIRGKDATRKNYAVSLKAYLHFLELPFASKIPLPKVMREPYVLISPETAVKVIVAGTREKIWLNNTAKLKNKLMRAGMLFILQTGLRIGEVCSLRGEDFSISSSPPQFIVKSKGGERETLPLTLTAVEIIKPFLHPGLLFKILPATCNIALARGAKEIRVPGITCHTLRHIYANDLNDSGIAPQKLQRLMRHKKFTTTDRYYLHNNIGDLFAIANSMNSLARKDLSADKVLDFCEGIVRKTLDSRFKIERTSRGLKVSAPKQLKGCQLT